MRSEAGELLAAIRAMQPKPARLMEVCGTHTMSIARAGIKTLLPEGAELLSGPGCPVCVTPAAMIDMALELARRPGVTVTSYGDMLRVPGSRPGDSLLRRRALGASVELVYSPVDAVELAAQDPSRARTSLWTAFSAPATSPPSSAPRASPFCRRNTACPP